MVLELLLHQGQQRVNDLALFDRRLGVFRIHASRIGLNAECFDLFSRCVPILGIPIVATGEVEYVAMSAAFDPVEAGREPPRYAVRFSGGRASFTPL